MDPSGNAIGWFVFKGLLLHPRQSDDILYGMIHQTVEFFREVLAPGI